MSKMKPSNIIITYVLNRIRNKLQTIELLTFNNFCQQFPSMCDDIAWNTRKSQIAILDIEIQLEILRKASIYQDKVLLVCPHGFLGGGTQCHIVIATRWCDLLIYWRFSMPHAEKVELEYHLLRCSRVYRFENVTTDTCRTEIIVRFIERCSL